MKKLFFISTLLFFSSFISFGQQEQNEELKINIQLRPRAEFRNGLFTPVLEGQKPAFFVAQRSRVGIAYSKNNKLKIGLSAQVVNTWGNDAQVQFTANDISLYEAWAQLYFSAQWNVKLGRQVLSYDDERILGALDWNNAGRKHDAALLGFEKNKLKADLGLAFNQNSEKVTGTFFNNSLSQPYKSMEFLWLKYKFSDALAMSILSMNLDFQNQSDSLISTLQTFGGNVFYKPKKWNITGTYYYQMGKKPEKSLPAAKTNAWMAAAKIDYNISKKFTAGLGTDYLSGNDMNSASRNVTAFNPLYGTHHKFYGFMDYFYVSSPHNNVGLWDSYLNLNFKSSERFDWKIALHHFESAAEIIKYDGGKAKAALGNEADLTFNYKIMTDVKLSGGYSQMSTNTSMKYVKNISATENMKQLQNWVWLSLNFNPNILIFKNHSGE